LIDQQNRYSLARLQVATWTTVVLSVWLAVVLVRVASNIPVGDALKVEIPDAVLVTLGISIGSFAFSSGIKDSKRKQEVTPITRIQVERDYLKAKDQVEVLTAQVAHQDAAAAVAVGDEKAALEMVAKTSKTELDARTAEMDALKKQHEAYQAADGLLVKNQSPSDATASDFFRGEETSDADTLDFGKVQMLWITIAVVAAYVFVLTDALQGGGLFKPGTAGVSLPDLPASVVALLGISHSGYLAVKASSSQKSEAKP
jgi:ribosome-binding factor A